MTCATEPMIKQHMDKGYNREDIEEGSGMRYGAQGSCFRADLRLKRWAMCITSNTDIAARQRVRVLATGTSSEPWLAAGTSHGQHANSGRFPHNQPAWRRSHYSHMPCRAVVRQPPHLQGCLSGSHAFRCALPHSTITYHTHTQQSRTLEGTHMIALQHTHTHLQHELCDVDGHDGHGELLVGVGGQAVDVRCVGGRVLVQVRELQAVLKVEGVDVFAIFDTCAALQGQG
eukprot:1159404-Pelagomonas_calceolata.AAC.2